MPRRVLRALVCAAFLSTLASPTLAHAALESATPGPGEQVTGSPAEIVAQFSQDLDPSRTSLEVRAVSGSRVARGGELGEGPREFRLDLPELMPGEYEVRWTSYSTEDDEIARDSYTFEVIAAPSLAPARSATATPPPSARPAASPLPSPTVPRSWPSGSPGAGSNTSGAPSGMDGSVVIPIVVALAAVSAFGLWALRRPRA